ncbi:MAG: DUF512 domain-containing protein [Bacillota bacterium]|nr:DUF512 domain-containing protein [Clostridia bacterium]
MEKEQLILQSVQEYNILPLTSACDANCVFCSHRDNPPEVEVVRIPFRTIEEVERTVSFLNEKRTIYIGESATKIIEGEPFTHPQWEKILRMVRSKFPRTLISITTNGRHINEHKAALLRSLEPLEMNFSLNSASVQGRQKLMGESIDQARKSILGAELLSRYGVTFHGSIVAMPHLVGWKDVEDTVVYLDRMGAKTIRIFMPGFSRLAPAELRFDPAVLHERLALFVKKVSYRIDCPVVLEPPYIRDLTPVVAGVIKDSPAHHGGLKQNDLVISVNEFYPRSRVEAWQKLQQSGKIEVMVKRNGEDLKLAWENLKGTKAGVVMNFDFAPQRAEEIIKNMGKNRGKQVLILCSTFAHDILKAVLRLFLEDCRGISLYPVINRFFGGSIGAAGLLTVGDFLKAWEDYCLNGFLPQVIFLPREAFDYQGRDLVGNGFWQLEERTGAKVEVT